MDECNKILDRYSALNTPNAQVILGEGEVPVISFPAFRDMPWLAHGFSTRGGGVSTGIFDSMNLSFTRGDDPTAVMENFRRFGKAVGMAHEAMVFTHQTHTTCVRAVGLKDRGKGITKARDYDQVDGLITQVPGVPLVTFYADCVPLFFADPKKKVIGSSHSGWRGTVARMGQKTVEAMAKVYGCTPKDLVAVIGPSVCQKCYEVSADVADAFRAAFPLEACQTFIEDKGTGKYMLDLWKANAYILQEAGLLRENIHISGVCTHCHPKLMWSHRSLGNERGSLAGFMMIKE